MDRGSVVHHAFVACALKPPRPAPATCYVASLARRRCQRDGIDAPVDGGSVVRIIIAAAVAMIVPIGSAYAAKPVCGDGRGAGPEQCDGTDHRGATCQSLGLPAGDLSCKSDCTFDTSGCSTPSAACGNGVVEVGEQCDGASDAACPAKCSAHCACPSAPPGDLQIHIVDVGQGDGILVISPDGFVTLFDAGNESAASAISTYLASINVTGIDYTAVSHMHADHVGGMDVLLSQHPEIVACFDHGGSFSTNEFDEYSVAAGDRRSTVTTGSTIDMGPSMIADVLHADTGNTTNENLNSVVIRLTYGNLTFLLGGDCEGPCEAMMSPGHIDAYKVHHHGASDSSTDAFLDGITPYTALISTGTGNSFGHPHQETLDALNSRQVAIHRTDLEGDLALIADGTSYTVNGQPVCTAGQTRTCGDSDVGACTFGQRGCVSGMWGACTGEVVAVPEVCGNGADDDCDGLADGVDPDCAPPTSHVVIAQVGYDTPGTDSVEEFVDLYNPTTAAVALDGWTLADGAASWTLPAGTTIDAGAYLTIAKDAAGFSALHGKDADVVGMSLALNNDGDSLTLDNGSVVDFVAWESFVAGWTVSANSGDSIERADPTSDSDTVNDWSVTSPATPRGGSQTGGSCGDGTCGAGEDCLSCAADCVGVTNGKPSNRYCCGNGSCEPAGEDLLVCPIDCN